MNSGLPGQPAHLRMIPPHRIPEFNLGNGTGRSAAVLLLLYPCGDGVCCVFIQRPEYDGYHSGQISLPGGKFQKTDRDLTHTALREASEEVGILPEQVKVLGAMTDLFIPPSNFLLTPILGYQLQKPEFVADPREVAEIFETDISSFNTANRKEKDITLHNGKVVRTPFYDIEGRVIWGATAMIMSEFELLTEGLF